MYCILNDCNHSVPKEGRQAETSKKMNQVSSNYSWISTIAIYKIMQNSAEPEIALNSAHSFSQTFGQISASAFCKQDSYKTKSVYIYLACPTAL